MNWGSPLLLGWFNDILAWFQDSLGDMLYYIANILLDLLYLIWGLLAGIINGIESIFRNLAGLGTDGKDMVSSIINNSAVQIIFKNLVGFATALIIFFTIVKVLQEHYKEKDGGNPYKIVIRTFKGLLMFFFVGTAVTVGLYATGVVFRGIDAATGGGNISLSAQVFKTMAYEANRVRQGRDEDGGLIAHAKNKRWSRMSADGGVEYGKYALVKMTEPTPNTPADVRAAYQKLCPEYNYGIVDANGIVSPIAPFLKSLINEQKTAQIADEETDSEKTNEYLENLKEWYGNGGITKNEGNFDNGSGSAAFGYQNDLLSALTLKIQPTINLDWSPVDIVDYYYEIMNDGEPVTWDVNITFMGTGVNISFAKEYVKYVYKGHDKKSLEDSAKSFGISLNGKTALQDGELSASFNLDMFDASRFQDILTSVVVNVLYTNLTKMTIEALPTMPGSYSVSGVKINLVQLLAPLIFNTLESVVNSSMIGLLPTAKDANGDVLIDEDGKEILAVEPFVIDGRNHNGGVWVNVNTKSEKMPVTIERYQVDGNFSELWSQLTDNWDRFTEEMEKAADQTWKVYEENEDLLERDIQKIEDQKDWLNYRDMMDLYNRDTIEYLTQIGNLLGMYDQAYKMADNRVDQIDIQLQRMGYAGTASDLEDEVKEIFVKMVAFYNAFKDTEPSKDVADAIYTSSIYKPIITFPYRDKYAQSMSFTDIKAALTGNNKDKIVVNMLLNEDDGYAYRLIDWNSYGYVYEQEFNKRSFVADLYSDPSYEVTEPANEANEKSYGKTLDQLKFRRLTDYPQEETLETQWDTQGLSYFLNAEGENNPFVKQTPRGGMKSVLYNNSYWGNRGVTVDGVRYYCYYNGEMVGIDLRNKGLGAKESTTASAQTVTVYSSSARKNALAATRKNETLKELQSMMEVSTEKNPLAEEFAKNIITFRKLGAASTASTDRKALNSWVKKGSIAAPIGAHEVYMVPSMTADQIDALMAGGHGQRHYLMLTEPGMSTPDANGEFNSYAGMFSYTSARTVNQLYDMGSMNYAIGFIAIIAAAGVYMNFAFGLIQRAVTMAVLYIMSPITISFYPFDDGSKFNQQFVSPFYKEAISAFAVIV